MGKSDDKPYYRRVNSLAFQHWRKHIAGQGLLQGLLLTTLVVGLRWIWVRELGWQELLLALGALVIYGDLAALWYWKRAPVELDGNANQQISELKSHLTAASAKRPFAIDFVGRDPEGGARTIIRLDVVNRGEMGDFDAQIVDLVEGVRPTTAVVPVPWTNIDSTRTTLYPDDPRQIALGDLFIRPPKERVPFTFRPRKPGPDRYLANFKPEFGKTYITVRVAVINVETGQRGMTLYQIGFDKKTTWTKVIPDE